MWRSQYQVSNPGSELLIQGPAACKTSLATTGFLVHISERCLVLLMNYCVSKELRVLKKNRYMKNLHKKVIIDDTGFRVDNVSV